jgi:hypothetical protein
MGPQINLFVCQPELAANVMSVKQNGIFRKAQQFGNFLVGLTLFDKIGNLDFHGGKIKMSRRKLADKRRNNVLQVGFHDADECLLIGVQPALI